MNTSTERRHFWRAPFHSPAWLVRADGSIHAGQVHDVSLKGALFEVDAEGRYQVRTVKPVGYGVPDPTAGSFTQEERRAALAREVEAAIRRFEPRLSHVSVQLQKLDRELIDRSLRVRIDAILRTDPVPEQVSFETVVRPTTLDVTVREGGPGGGEG